MKRLILSNRYFYFPFAAAITGCLIVIMLIPKGASVLWLDKYSHAAADHFFKYFTQVGEGLVVTLIIILLGSFRLVNVIYGAAIMLANSALTQFMKRVVFTDMERPSVFLSDVPMHVVEGVHLNSQFSFPSGHASAAFALFCLAALVSRDKKWGWVFLLIAAVVAVSRVYLKQHFLQDVTAGAFLGAAVATVVYYFLHRVFDSRSWASLSIWRK